MVINNFNGVGITVFPDEADAPLVIYPDAVLADAIASQRFQSIGGWHSHIIQSFRAMELHQLAQCGALNVRG